MNKWIVGDFRLPPRSR